MSFANAPGFAPDNSRAGPAVSWRCYVSLLVILLLHTGAAASPGPPTGARVIDSFSQLGVDTAAPRFGWVDHDTARGEIQTAYQVIVTADQADADQGGAARWDSGKVVSAQQDGIVYAGAALARTTSYCWKVRTWNREDQVSPWSEDGSFVTSFFGGGGADAARWIQHPQATDQGAGPPPMFRKAFELAKPVRHAFLYISGLGQFVSFLNGAKIGDHEIDPAWTDYDKTVNYVTFDVTARLRPGGNALGVLLGPGWYGNAATEASRHFGPLKLWPGCTSSFGTERPPK